MRTVIVFPADCHSGSTLGLIRPEPYQLEDGGTYHPNKLQKVIWKQWAACWDRVAELRQGGRLVICHVGDAIEGAHHDMRQVVTTNLTQQKDIHVEAMDWAMKRAAFADSDRLFYISGTPIHVGTTECEIGRDLGAVPSIPDSKPDKRDGRYAWYRLQLDSDNIHLDIAHQGASPGARAWTRENTLQATLKNYYFTSLESGSKPPDYFIRAHKHSKVEAVFCHKSGRMTGIILPAFQAITEFANKTGAHVATIGMLIIVIEDGRTWYECNTLALDVERVVKL